ncbi:MAG: hypothetical protein R2909_08350 [Gemmatimonadales bacterium]
MDFYIGYHTAYTSMRNVFGRMKERVGGTPARFDGPGAATRSRARSRLGRISIQSQFGSASYVVKTTP